MKKKIHTIKRSKTNRLKKDYKFIYYFCGSLVFASLVILNLSLFITNKTKVIVLGSQDTNNNDILFWTNLLNNYPTYKEGWTSLARLEYEKGNFRAAVTAMDNASKIDPNSEVIEAIKKDLGI